MINVASTELRLISSVERFFSTPGLEHKNVVMTDLGRGSTLTCGGRDLTADTEWGKLMEYLIHKGIWYMV